LKSPPKAKVFRRANQNQRRRAHEAPNDCRLRP
jgi:hypothetical protein